MEELCKTTTPKRLTRGKIRRQRCGNCVYCLREDCGKCRNCLKKVNRGVLRHVFFMYQFFVIHFMSSHYRQNLEEMECVKMHV